MNEKELLKTVTEFLEKKNNESMHFIPLDGYGRVYQEPIVKGLLLDFIKECQFIKLS